MKNLILSIITTIVSIPFRLVLPLRCYWGRIYNNGRAAARGEHVRSQAHDTKPIRIGSDVWVGRGACILPGVTIVDGAIIGVNSIVTKDVPANSIAAGIPAKVIRER